MCLVGNYILYSNSVISIPTGYVPLLIDKINNKIFAIYDFTSSSPYTDFNSIDDYELSVDIYNTLTNYYCSQHDENLYIYITNDVNNLKPTRTNVKVSEYCISGRLENLDYNTYISITSNTNIGTFHEQQFNDPKW